MKINLIRNFARSVTELWSNPCIGQAMLTLLEHWTVPRCSFSCLEDIKSSAFIPCFVLLCGFAINILRRLPINLCQAVRLFLCIHLPGICYALSDHSIKKILSFWNIQNYVWIKIKNIWKLCLNQTHVLLVT